MRILVVCQHYWPEPFNTSDVCECLAARGHEVTVLTALPNTGMPGGEVPAEYRDEACRNSCRNGVRVIRVPLAPPSHRRDQPHKELSLVLGEREQSRSRLAG